MEVSALYMGGMMRLMMVVAMAQARVMPMIILFRLRMGISSESGFISSLFILTLLLYCILTPESVASEILRPI